MGGTGNARAVRAWTGVPGQGSNLKARKLFNVVPFRRLAALAIALGIAVTAILLAASQAAPVPGAHADTGIARAAGGQAGEARTVHLASERPPTEVQGTVSGAGEEASQSGAGNRPDSIPSEMTGTGPGSSMQPAVTVVLFILAGAISLIMMGSSRMNP